MDDGELLTHVYEMLDFQNKIIFQYWTGWISLSPWVSNFQDLIRDVAGIGPADVEYSHLLGGYPNLLYESNTILGRLAQQAVDDSLDGILLNNDPSEVIPAMKESESGNNLAGAPIEKFGSVETGTAISAPWLT